MAVSSVHKQHLVFYCILLLLLSNLTSSCSSIASSQDEHSSSTILRKQAEILVSLKHSFQLDSSSFSLLHSWNVSNYISLCSSWTGIQCKDNTTTTASVVVSLDLSNLNISGVISPVLTELKTLVNLSISGNDFSGLFPFESIHKLTSLRYLNISNNQFNGSLLNWNFTHLKELEFFDAYDNNFFGSLPLGVNDLPKLKHLNLGGNYFSGNIPSSYGDLKELNFLSLAGNDLSGFIPSELGNLTNLKYLSLGYFNDYQSGIPPEFGNLVNLVHLDLSNCSLEGSIPTTLGNLNKLDTLFLSTNQLTGSIPSQFGNLSSLKTLDLSNNGLTGEIPAEFSQLRELNLLNLFFNKFHGEIPSSIAELPNLEVLNLWQNNFTGVIPPKLGMHGRLVELDLSTNKLTGVIPKSLCFGRKLKILILLHNFLFGPIPKEIGECVTLSRVRMGQNYLTGSIPYGLLYLPELALIELQGNYLTGSLAEDLSHVPTKLGQLNLSSNRLSGSLPSSFGNFTGLQSLLLSSNRFTGRIPSEFGKLKHVLKFDMSKNNFSGEIPPEIGNCILLTYLDLSQNQFSGPIPVQLSQIHILNYLNISWNQLSQSLPKEIGAMKSLTSADFSHNDFSGSIPENGQFAYFNPASFVGNPQLCGSYLNPCNYSTSSSMPFNDQQDNSKSSNTSRVPGKLKLVLALGLLVFSLIFALFAILKTRSLRRRRRDSKTWKLTAFQKLGFCSEDILECLKDTNIIGRGGAGIVYKGTMPNGEQVAVKRLLGISKGSSHDNGFSAEIQTLGRIRHRYIVRLLAFCSNKETNLLVYEYMPNGSLGELLHGKSGGYLKWESRLKIAMEAAKGLCYLHHDCSPLILHRDVKSNNILLDSDLEAHVADFGLAKFLLQDTGTSECMSAIAGSYGYIAPEYAYTLKVDEKSDVYSFGVVLLELITGKRPVGDFGEEGLDIVQWAKMNTNWSKEGVVKILDQRLLQLLPSTTTTSSSCSSSSSSSCSIDNIVPLDEAMQVFFVGMLCVQEQSVERPTMREVVQMLSQAKQSQRFQVL